jgi:hypothetical protein
MKDDGTPHPVTVHPFCAGSDTFQQDTRQFLAPKQQAEMNLLEPWVLQQATEDLFASVVEQDGKLFLGRRSRCLAIDFR